MTLSMRMMMTIDQYMFMIIPSHRYALKSWDMMASCYPCVLNYSVFCYVVWNLPLEFGNSFISCNLV
jgi:hypothetical protein